MGLFDSVKIFYLHICVRLSFGCHTECDHRFGILDSAKIWWCGRDQIWPQNPIHPQIQRGPIQTSQKHLGTFKTHKSANKRVSADQITAHSRCYFKIICWQVVMVQSWFSPCTHLSIMVVIMMKMMMQLWYKLCVRLAGGGGGIIIGPAYHPILLDCQISEEQIGKETEIANPAWLSDFSWKGTESGLLHTHNTTHLGVEDIHHCM